MTKKINFRHSDTQLKKALKPIFAYDIALLYPTCSEEDKKRILALIGLDKLTDMFVELNVDDQLDLLNCIDETKKRSLFRNMESDDLKEFIEDIEASERDVIFSYLSKIKAKTISLLLTYEEDMAASIMSTDFITVSIDQSIKAATDHVIRDSKEQDYIDTIFVVDLENRIVGIVDLKDLIKARSNSSLTNIMKDDFQFVYDHETIEKAIQTVVDYDRNAIPVLDDDDHVIGIVTADDIFDEIIEATESDYQKMALLQDHESSSSAWIRSKQRLPWLMIAVVLNILIASFLSIFEATLAEVTAIVLFQPLILGMAGNIGTQALAVTILGIHKNELDGKYMPKEHIVKELFIGFLNSLILAIAAFGFVTGFLSLFPTSGTELPFQMGLVVLIAVFSSMFISALMGVFVPMILHKNNQNPAAASGPIMTTLNDLVALVIYFGVATLAFL
ncbi:MAG: magnesium transporter [Acholeplasmataceae bacterium]|jgi:magnesium transporter|nr:magnesium transporter [Acholeplasmataceae bacterium]